MSISELEQWLKGPVQYITIFAYLHDFVYALPRLGEILTVSIAITGYFQTSKSRPVTTANWIPSANWTPVPDSLCSCSHFQEVIARYNNEKSSWFQLPIFRELGLNIQGRKDARKERKDERTERKVSPITYIMISISHITFL